jgi:hypothetical protein
MMLSLNHFRPCVSERTFVLRMLICCALLSLAPLTFASTARYSEFRSGPAVPSQFAIADFDGDQLPDFATVQMGKMTGSAAHYSIQIELSRGAMQTVSLIAPIGGLEINLRDVNGDQALDLVVSTQLLKGPVAVLLNDGHGNFSVVDPGIYPSAACDQSFHWNIALEEIRDWAVLPLSRDGYGQLDETGRPRAVCESSERIGAAEICRPSAPATSSRLGRSPPHLN